jgi:peptidoglycan hydrolase-like protein with peptidoglycan-binding domain
LGRHAVGEGDETVSAVPGWWGRVLAEGDRGGDVWVARRLLGCQDGRDFDLAVAAAVRGVQLKAGLPVSGEIDPETAAVLGSPEWATTIPDWWVGPVTADSSPDVIWEVQKLLGLPRVTGRWTRGLERAVRRFQGQHGIPPSGVVCEETARALRLA